MPKPNSIRTAEWLVYVKLLLSLMTLGINIAIVISPTLQQQSKVNLKEFTAGELVLNLVFMAIPVAAAVLTVYYIRRKKRMPALLAAVLLLVFSIRNQIELVIGLVIVFLLFTRSAKSYFNSMSATGKERTPLSTEALSAELEETRPVPIVKVDPIVDIRPAGAEDAAVVHSLMMEAFEEYSTAVPPSSALEETVESVREGLESGQEAAILYEGGRPAAMVRYEMRDDAITFFRLSVIPSRRRRGYAKRLVRWIEQQGRSQALNVSRCRVRQTVQNNVAMYQDMGYEIVDQELVVRPEGTVKTLTMEKKLLG
ncbi:GNAT family N-acetyltransferase [Cohnella pontilimi]|uniref:GNAT family N-acetyltransferase n=1 Tax=Cohnella pontilimi TaxID=2564100 RepID=UPI00145E3FC9|nr:GNAT family N-acetyltransferase [Cohnella pontilimi]